MNMYLLMYLLQCRSRTQSRLNNLLFVLYLFASGCEQTTIGLKNRMQISLVQWVKEVDIWCVFNISHKVFRYCYSYFLNFWYAGCSWLAIYAFQGYMFSMSIDYFSFFIFVSLVVFLLLFFVSFIIVVVFFCFCDCYFFAFCEHGHANLWFNILFSYLFFRLIFFWVFPKCSGQRRWRYVWENLLICFYIILRFHEILI